MTNVNLHLSYTHTKRQVSAAAAAARSHWNALWCSKISPRPIPKCQGEWHPVHNQTMDLDSWRCRCRSVCSYPYIYSPSTSFQFISNRSCTKKVLTFSICVAGKLEWIIVYLCSLQLMLEKDRRSTACIFLRYCLNISTHRTSVSTTARTVSISAIVFDLIDFRVITIPDKTLPIVPKT